MAFSSLSSCLLCFGDESPFSWAGDLDLLLLLLLFSSGLLDLDLFSWLLDLDRAADLEPDLLEADLLLDLESLLLLERDLLLEPPLDRERDLERDLDLDLRAERDLDRDLPLEWDLDLDLDLLLKLPSGTNLILLPFNSVSSILSIARFMSSYVAKSTTPSF